MTCRFAGAKLQVTPTGSVVAPGGPAQERLIKPVKLLTGVIVVTMVPDAPTLTDKDVGAIPKAKSGVAVTSGCTVMLSDWEAAWALSPL